MFRVLCSSLRWPAALAMLVTAATHVPLVPEHLEEARYAGVLFIALSVVSLVLAVLLVVGDSVAVWSTSGVVALLTVVAFVVSRTVGLPQLGDDVGNWFEPLGYPAAVAELVTVALSGSVLRNALLTPAPRGRHLSRTQRRPASTGSTSI